MSGHVFISYSRQDRAYVEQLAAHLRGAGLNVWVDDRIEPGDQWSAVIGEKLKSSGAFVIVMTPAAEQSRWVAREIRLAERLGKLMLPLLLDGEIFWNLAELQTECVAGGTMPSDRFVARLWSVVEPKQVPTYDYISRLEEGVQARTAGPLGRLIRDLTDPYDLEVHQAIGAAAGVAELPTLPIYVSRAHDKRLGEIVERAVGGDSALAVLVAGSSTGKTRACWEAIQVLPEGWRLWHPIDPGRPEAFLDGLAAVGSQTVIWLNEAQHYLLTGSGLGERVAAGLRELLRTPERGPVLVVGTVWPEYWSRLTTVPSSGEPDPHAQARALLSGADIAVPDRFHGVDLHAAQVAARNDPRLDAAVRDARDGQITQFLAGVPVLLERYRNAPPVAKAVIHAAMDARREGAGTTLSRSLLAALAPGYLTDQQWDAAGEDWLEQALLYTAPPCRGVRGLLTPIRPRPGQSAPGQSCYYLADYLVQTARGEPAPIPPAALWDTLWEHADKNDMLAIGSAAEQRRLFRYAFQFYLVAAENGHTYALRCAVSLLQREGRHEGLIWLQARAEAGDAEAASIADRLRSEACRVEEAIVSSRRLAEKGDEQAVMDVAENLRYAGRADEAIEWLQTHVESGATDLLCWVLIFMRQAGRNTEAGRYVQARKEAGDSNIFSMSDLRSLQDAGRTEKSNLGASQDTGQDEETDGGDHPPGRLPLPSLADLLRRWKVEEFRQLRVRGEAGVPIYLLYAAEVARDLGQINVAIDLALRAVEGRARNFAMDEEVVDGSLLTAVDLLREAGRTDDATHLLRYGLEPGAQIAIPWTPTQQPTHP